MSKSNGIVTGAVGGVNSVATGGCGSWGGGGASWAWTGMAIRAALAAPVASNARRVKRADDGRVRDWDNAGYQT
ncbi:hypothetical protein [Falsirhodobacter halotolerans]|uniref:hypothetical protein n=1 Tax=Falsirhodobacter halotolerans TaxID=1146892 RepID=UPI001FCFFD74|nr:hypothetical protein [Falsirhodobacter halotolerans]MCJ8139212.1 hypothetical protein [Falsirhodobacter halotolerans]